MEKKEVSGVSDRSIRRQKSLRDKLQQLASLVRRQRETIAQLTEDEKMFKAVAEGSVAPIFVLQGRKFRYVNTAMMALCGFSKQELLSMDFWRLAHPEYRSIVRRRGFARQRGGHPPSHYEFAIVTKSGKKRWIDFVDGLVKYKGKRAAIGSAFDLTERKELEKDLLASREEIRKLAAHISYVRQSQMSRLAQEIHDELGPVLTGIKMVATALSKGIRSKGNKEQSSFLEDIDELEHLSDRGFTKLRAITAMLKPWVPDILDLPYLLESLARGFEKLTKISCSVHSQFEVLTLKRDTLTAVYMIVQEALTNIARHSGAKRASIFLEKQDDQLVIKVKDNGRGISEESKLNYRTLGLLGMKERADFLGGELRIRGKKNYGTVVELKFPFVVPPRKQSQG